VTLASGAYADDSAVSGAANAGDIMRVGINTAASGCTVSGAALWWTAEYGDAVSAAKAAGIENEAVTLLLWVAADLRHNRRSNGSS